MKTVRLYFIFCHDNRLSYKRFIKLFLKTVFVQARPCL